MKVLKNSFFILILNLASISAYSAEADLISNLKKEVEFDQIRKKDFTKYSERKNIFEREREKGLSIYIEDQERWDYLREQGVEDVRRQRRLDKKIDESSPEFLADEKLKMKRELEQDQAREQYVNAKRALISRTNDNSGLDEATELELHSNRPRYAKENRNKNKWLSAKTASSKNTPSSGTSGYNAGGYDAGYVPPAPGEYNPPPPDFSAYPSDGFEDLPPPPPPLPYDDFGNPQVAPHFNDNFDSNPNINYPPPPVDGGWDF